LTDEQTKLLAAGVAAVYHHKIWLAQAVSNGAYNFEKQKRDWVDFSQLSYLTDPNIHFLTDDERLGGRVANIAQKGRILFLREFLKARSFAVRHEKQSLSRRLTSYIQFQADLQKNLNPI
jgi:hypothetical protein